MGCIVFLKKCLKGETLPIQHTAYTINYIEIHHMLHILIAPKLNGLLL